MAEMPISTIIVVVLCLIVLFAVTLLLLGVWNPFKDSTSLEVAKNNACQKLVSIGCNSVTETKEITIQDYDANNNGTLNDNGGIAWNKITDCGPGATSGDNLATLCLCRYNRLNDNSCKSLCGCETTGSSSGSCPSNCVNNDGSCPSGCNNNCDSDCPPSNPH